MPDSVGPKEGAGDVDIFLDDDAHRHVLALMQFIGARAQNGAHHGLDPRQRPAALQGRVDLAVDHDLLVEHALQNIAKEADLGGLILLALDFAAHPMGLEFGENVVEALARDFHLIKRLHDG